MTQPHSAKQGYGRLVFFTMLLGVLVGLSSALLSAFLTVIAKVFLNFHESYLLAGPSTVPGWRRLLSVLIGAIMAGCFWYYQRRQLQPFVGIKKALSGEQMPVKSTVINVLTQMFFVGTGGSVGRELAPRQAGVMIAQQVTGRLNRFPSFSLSKEDRTLLLAAAAGAGFAGVYIAPITGMLFAVEMLLKKASVKNVTVSLAMAGIATGIGGLEKGFHPYYGLAETHFFWAALVAGCVIGPITGLLGIFVKKTFDWAQQKQVTGHQILWAMPVVGLLTGLLAYFIPEVMGNGRPLAQLTFQQNNLQLLWVIVGIGLLKFVLVAFSFYGGATGGAITPALSLGAVVGLLLAGPGQLLLPNLLPWHYAFIGAVSLLAATQQAPLMALFMLVEIAHLQPITLLYLFPAVWLSYAVAKKGLAAWKN
ncbi:chloride channel protein [Leuconostocaceae bacterium ESL0958]|nr:chloride channel protein [Leuconostocaceae bacterium ESL0958]